jgi:hypothetical protein
MATDEVEPRDDASSEPPPDGNGKGSKQPPIAIAVPPLPPGAQAPSVSLAVATQILQQPGGCYALPLEIQKQFVDGVNQLDRYNHEQALKTIDCDERAHVREVDDRKTRRWQVLIVVAVVLAIVAGMVMFFLSRGESERAMQLFESGANILLGLLGGVGLAKSGLFSDAKSGGRDED